MCGKRRARDTQARGGTDDAEVRFSMARGGIVVPCGIRFPAILEDQSAQVARADDPPDWCPREGGLVHARRLLF